MKIVYGLDGDSTIPVVYTSAEGSNPAADLPNVVVVGEPFLAFESLPEAIEGNIGWNPAGAPRCSADEAKNRAAIDAMLASPPLSKVFVAP